jgi:hypothetical protein
MPRLHVRHRGEFSRAALKPEPAGGRKGRRLTFWDGTRWIQTDDETGQPRKHRRTRDWIATLLMALSVAALVLPMSRSLAAVPVLLLTPGEVAAGDQVDVGGHDFPPKSSVQLTWDGNPSAMPLLKVAGNGSIRGRFTAPVASSGPHLVTVITDSGTAGPGKGAARTASTETGQLAAAWLTIISGDEPPPVPPAEPTVSATPIEGTPSPVSAPTLSPAPSLTPPTTPVATPTPTPTPIPTSTARPQGGIFAYYYLWWSARHWHDKLGPAYAYADIPLPLPAVIGIDGCSTSTLYAGNQMTDVPTSLAAQDQDDPASVERDVRNAVSAGLGGFFVNWIGTGLPGQTMGDITYSRRLQYVIDAAHKVTAEGTPFFVVLSYRGSLDTLRTQAELTNDFEYLLRTYANDPALFRPYGNRPMLTWEGSRLYPSGTIQAVSNQFRPAFFMMADEDANTWPSHAAYFDGATRYYSTQQVTTSSFNNMKMLGDQVHASALNPDGTRKLWYSSFTPGHNSFLLTGSTNCTPRNDGQTMVSLFDGNAASNPDGWALISWNEIAEGTYVLPLQRYGARYLDVLRQLAAR